MRVDTCLILSLRYEELSKKLYISDGLHENIFPLKGKLTNYLFYVINKDRLEAFHDFKNKQQKCMK